MEKGKNKFISPVKIEGHNTTCRPFSKTMEHHGLILRRDITTILQVNAGLICNQVCRHCHLEAGPAQKEFMAKETVDDVAAFAKRSEFQIIDITGGAPELIETLPYMIESFYGLAPVLILRSNLSAINDGDTDYWIGLLKSKKITVVASFPSVNEKQADSLRGDGIFQKSLMVLRKLNDVGYGKSGTGLVLNLVSNPAGAFLPASQAQEEKRFRKILKSKWELEFNELFNFTNIPLGRFKKWLEKTDNYEKYMHKLADNFNPDAVSGVMCRSLVSVSWDGYLYDCDFNLAADIPLGKERKHVSEMDGPPEEGSKIAISNHCYGCTAGAGFT